MRGLSTLGVLARLGIFMPLAVQAAPSVAAAGDAGACQSAIQAVERAAPIPPALLSAIARTESGRVLPGGRLVPWPWTINVAGTGHYYDSAPEAVAAVEAFRATGVQSIDVGCMQVNLMHHPAAFATLEQAFNPAANVRYAAQFLKGLQTEVGTWPAAVGAYHSRTPDLASDYGRRVMQAWPLAAAYGGTVYPGNPGVRAATERRLPVVDPYGVYTPEFSRRIAAEAAFRAARDGSFPLQGGRRQSGLLARRSPSQLHLPGDRTGAVRLAQADLASSPLRRP